MLSDAELADFPADHHCRNCWRQYVQWADDHFRRRGSWPNQKSRQMEAGAAGNMDWNRELFETDDGAFQDLRPWPICWPNIENARNKANLSPLDEQQILKWAQDHFRSTGKLPTQSDREVADAPGETWPTMDAGVRVGRRGLPAGSSLSDLLKKAGMSKRWCATGASSLLASVFE